MEKKEKQKSVISEFLNYSTRVLSLEVLVCLASSLAYSTELIRLITGMERRSMNAKKFVAKKNEPKKVYTVR